MRVVVATIRLKRTRRMSQVCIHVYKNVCMKRCCCGVIYTIQYSCSACTISMINVSTFIYIYACTTVISAHKHMARFVYYTPLHPSDTILYIFPYITDISYLVTHDSMAGQDASAAASSAVPDSRISG